MKSQVLFELFIVTAEYALPLSWSKGAAMSSGGPTRSCPKYGKSSSALSWRFECRDLS